MSTGFYSKNELLRCKKTRPKAYKKLDHSDISKMTDYELVNALILLGFYQYLWNSNKFRYTPMLIDKLEKWFSHVFPDKFILQVKDHSLVFNNFI